VLALCVNCGQIELSDNCMNPTCAATQADNDLRQIFREWYFGMGGLESLSAAVVEINNHCSDTALRRFAFLDYVGKNHPGVLSLEDLDPILQAKVDALLSRCAIPVFVEAVITEEQREALRKAMAEDDDLP
jgi:hypothetical protein